MEEDEQITVVFVCSNCKTKKPKGHALVKCEQCGSTMVEGVNPYMALDNRRVFVEDQRRHGAQ